MRRYSVIGMLALGVALAAVATQAGAQTLGTAGTDISGADSRTRETSAGNLVADAVRSAAHADAAIVAADALTDATIDRGPITRADLKTLLQDPEEGVATLSLTGAQLKVVLERSVNAYPKPFGGFLQVSGLSVTFDPARPAGSRVTRVLVNGQALDANRKYRVGTLATLAGGGLGYFRIWNESDVTGGGPSVLNALASYVQNARTVSPRVEGRVASK